MAWSHGNSNNNGPAGGTGTFTLAVTAGDLIVGFISFGTTSATAAMSDSVNGSYTQAVKADSNRPSTQAIFYTIATTTATVTISGSGSQTVDLMHASNFSNNSGTIPGTVNATNSSSTSQSTTVTTSAAGCLIVGFGDSSTSNTAGTGFTSIAATVNATRCTSEYQTTMSSANGANTVALVEGVQRGIVAAAFDPPAAAAFAALKNEFAMQAVNRASSY